MLEKLKNLIFDEYKRQEINIRTQSESVHYVSPLIELSEEQREILEKGDGQKLNEYKQINSSTGLAVNYYKLMEDLDLISELIFEKKPAIPLEKSQKFVNIDVFYKRNGTLYFVESKFLEPYYNYNGNEVLVDAYFDEDRYPIEIQAFHNEWHQLFLQSKDFQYYDVAQLCRHLLALYRYTHGYEGSEYQGEPVVLQSVTWEMPEHFINLLSSPSDRDKMRERVEALKEEAKRCHDMFNTLINKIDWNNMTFETLHYNDMLDEIKSNEHYRDFCKRYFF